MRPIHTLTDADARRAAFRNRGFLVYVAGQVEDAQQQAQRAASAQTASPSPGLIEPVVAPAQHPAPRIYGSTESAGRPRVQQDRQRAIAISMHVMDIVGDAAAGILLSQLIYWTRRSGDARDRDGWIFKTATEWEHETGMSWKVQRRARALLCNAGLMQERKLTMPARLEFRLKLDVLGSLLAQRSDVEMHGPLDLARFTNRDDPFGDQLLGRGFLFHSALARVFPVHTAMMCSRLVATVRGQVLHADVGPSSTQQPRITPLVQLQRTEWRRETGLSRDQWQTARRNLRDAGALVERLRNYPRRVDLALDLTVLARVMKRGPAQAQPEMQGARLSAQQPGASQEVRQAGLDRAKQAGGIGQRPIPLSQSPDSTFKDRPIQPLSVAQSRLYCVLHEALLPLQPQAAREGGEVAFLAFGCGGGGGLNAYGIPKTAFGRADSGLWTPAPVASTLTPAHDGPQQAPKHRTESAVALGALAWPSVFTEADRDQAARHLAGLETAMQQTVLDEIEWQHHNGKSNGKPVRSPVALTRTLCKHAKAGTFAPDGAHRVAGDRQREAEAELRRAAAAQPPASGTAVATPVELRKPIDQSVKDRLKRTRDAIEAGLGIGGRRLA